MRKSVLCAVLVLFGGCTPRPQGAVGVVETPPEDAAGVASLKETLIDVTKGANRLVIAYCGSPVELLRRDCIKGYGLSACVINRRARRAVWHETTGGEAGPEVMIDFSRLGEGVLEWTEYAWDPRAAPESVPFCRQTIVVKPDGSCKKRVEILLPAEEGDAAQIDELRRQATQAFQSGAENAMDKYTEVLCQLRGIAVKRPREVLATLEQIPSEGHFECIKWDVAAEVEILLEVAEGP